MLDGELLDDRRAQRRADEGDWPIAYARRSSARSLAKSSIGRAAALQVVLPMPRLSNTVLRNLGSKSGVWNRLPVLRPRVPPPPTHTTSGPLRSVCPYGVAEEPGRERHSGSPYLASVSGGRRAEVSSAASRPRLAGAPCNPSAPRPWRDRSAAARTPSACASRCGWRVPRAVSTGRAPSRCRSCPSWR